MNIKNTFLSLTQWTVPYGSEDTLVVYLPNGTKKDMHGNYYITVGESRTLFTSHLDTYSTKRLKVTHVIDGDIIRTDGRTILGGDNKAGVTILLYMISKGVPGTYYFFVGEEVGTIGSKAALMSNVEYFSKFKRCVAFDRRRSGSIITEQLGEVCCSDTFANALGKQFAEQGLEYGADDTGMYTDSAVFMDVIPECTNISAGVWNEHQVNEYVDIKLVEAIAKASAKINWETLPVSRCLTNEAENDGWVNDDYDYMFGSSKPKHRTKKRKRENYLPDMRWNDNDLSY
jgi:hypothetical protein